MRYLLTTKGIIEMTEIPTEAISAEVERILAEKALDRFSPIKVAVAISVAYVGMQLIARNEIAKAEYRRNRSIQQDRK